MCNEILLLTKDCDEVYLDMSHLCESFVHSSVLVGDLPYELRVFYKINVRFV